MPYLKVIYWDFQEVCQSKMFRILKSASVLHVESICWDCDRKRALCDVHDLRVHHFDNIAHFYGHQDTFFKYIQVFIYYKYLFVQNMKGNKKNQKIGYLVSYIGLIFYRRMVRKTKDFKENGENYFDIKNFKGCVGGVNLNWYCWNLKLIIFWS